METCSGCFCYCTGQWNFISCVTATFCRTFHLWSNRKTLTTAVISFAHRGHSSTLFTCCLPPSSSLVLVNQNQSSWSGVCRVVTVQKCWTNSPAYSYNAVKGAWNNLCRWSHDTAQHKNDLRAELLRDIVSRNMFSDITRCLCLLWRHCFFTLD